MTNKINRDEFVKILATELATQLEDTGIKATQKLAAKVLTAVEEAYVQAIVVEQAEVSLGTIGKFKPVIKPEQTFSNPANRDQEVTKPERLTVKFVVGGTFKKQVEAAEIN